MKKLRKKLGSQNYFKGLTRSQQNQFAQTMGATGTDRIS